MTTKLTLFTATLVQDSALSVSGHDRESTSDQPFTIVEGVPTLVGRGLKGAAVAMAKRFFDPLPRAVSDDVKHGALRRSAWEFADATTTTVPDVRAGVGIRHKTGARADGVLYDREVIPVGTTWALSFRVDWSQCPKEGRDDEGREAEGILGYVLAKHWAHGRCWLGGGVARGLGWCHIEDLRAYRFDEASYDAWVESGRPRLPPPITGIDVPVVEPTRSWCFRTLDVKLSFGNYMPEPKEAPWGLDMFTVGPHDTLRTVQLTGDGQWARPAWTDKDDSLPETLSTDRALLMAGGRPLLPGASVRGPLRHAFSRHENEQSGRLVVEDPNRKGVAVGEDDAAGQAFGTVNKSSRILIRDARAETGWAAAKLHMHAEDEFSAGSYGSAKRDAVRVLEGVFPVRVVIEGETPEEVESLVRLIDHQVMLGALGHLPVGGHKTRGAGWGRWEAQPWINDDVQKVRTWVPLPAPEATSSLGVVSKHDFERPERKPTEVWVHTEHGALHGTALILGEAMTRAKEALGDAFIAWWCDPTIDLNRTKPPATFGREWPVDEKLQVDEVAFYAERAAWRAVRGATGLRFVLIKETTSNEEGAQKTTVVHTPARLHGFSRFSSANTGQGNVLIREWHIDDEILGFTLSKEEY